MIFSRKGDQAKKQAAAAGKAPADTAGKVGRADTAGKVGTAGKGGAAKSTRAAAAATTTTSRRGSAGAGATRRAPVRDHGPFDISEAPADVKRIDLGSLQIPAVDGVEVRVAADNEGRVQQVLLVDGASSSALEVGAFAAPRTEGIWDEVREEISAGLTASGGKAHEVDGDYGTELRARVTTPQGQTDIRFVGVDGPRWMVRAVFQGAAATDPDAATLLDQMLRGLVVDRGVEAFPVRDALPLRLPRELAEQAQQQAAEAGDDAN